MKELARLFLIIVLLFLAWECILSWMGTLPQQASSGSRSVVQVKMYQPRIKAQKGTHDYYVALARYDAVFVGIDPDVYQHQITVESHFDPFARSATGDIGIAQFQPTTAAHLPNPLGNGSLNAWDPEQALLAAATLMDTYVEHYRSYEAALAAYNCGSSCVNRAIEQGQANWWAYLPVSTRSYVLKILQKGAIESGKVVAV